ncbi:MAG: hypothetical protein A3C80_02895 [Candidatus Ryanbacteria bacterium RIFCSPHIGHO2_02_FULL_45_43]|uniref:Uncharacterized protein n=1 Tax=Candidatus Ryanbacteria bacterium RIFCSPHIGHO2_01_45_13 TaxID=1802112 RepID=A0A1G2FUJ9_9BACT|nr:MAG: hypothetical protein A2W41_00985 [Candidatus Ryanbacteria bacterium RIFCSPHIGHO2_01_45_13]OGZ41765.1 MAG: hypothetical protein A2718_00410 [Candidatus Ryanbacteria bacterium RIFCSPHIGHO2_01_FULL_44_130]OGZ48060.1 MAG: hypothetical protein A3C80_02895 [Candidatus Ryanbacteria bacterium RIFCSPHIGHO2_02_FULL_45_43]OGZ50192.1 MAG: hypothetical protein A3E55_01510 [Candidatus Ryanbacteria bacterium RIFCSPHIGHO2_12_FULL_44_20]OGZ51066.1 MAG: hypothetical protein A3A17_02325 [Candidatus Ryanba
MVDVELDERGMPIRRYSSRAPKIVQWLVNYSGGYIKNERWANYVLFVFAVLVFIGAMYLLSTSVSGPYIPKEALKNPELGLPVKD